MQKKAWLHNEQSRAIIIGAGRSGTNMLRDILTQLSGFGTWPCDEINYIWRHGNIRSTTDELKPEQATPAVKQFIQHQFQQVAERFALRVTVEKTCANSLRVGFVNEVIADAKYIFIVRDGRDVIASALKRWVAPLDVTYIAAKARYVPFKDLPYYGSRYFGNRLYRLFSGEKRLAFWGPRFNGMADLLRHESLPVVCAHQWRRCVERSAEDFALIDAKRVYQLRYEDLVQQPQQQLQQILDFLAVSATTTQVQRLTQGISIASIGKWRTELPPETLTLVNPIIQPVLKKYGYT